MQIDQREALTRINISNSKVGAIQTADAAGVSITGFGYIGKGDTIPTRSLHLGPLDAYQPTIQIGAVTGKADPFKTGQVGGTHYERMAIQPFEYSMANGLDPMQHTVVKYVTRFREKNGIEDLKKARHVIDLLIANETKTKP